MVNINKIGAESSRNIQLQPHRNISNTRVLLFFSEYSVCSEQALVHHNPFKYQISIPCPCNIPNHVQIFSTTVNLCYFLIANNSRTTEHSLIHQNWPQIFCLNCLTNLRIMVFTCLMLGWADLIHFNSRISTFHRVPLENIMCTVQNLYCVEWYQQYIRKLLCCRLSVQQTDADEWADGMDW